ncbi:MAG: type II CAAX prenyl endopeptidase Rce1 family protein [Halovenus sp.]
MEEPDGPGENHCPSCGEALNPSDRFCPSCGTRTDHPESQQPAASDGDDFERSEDERGTDSQTDTELQNGGWEQSKPVDPQQQAGGGSGDGEPVADGSPGSPGAMRGRETPLRTAGVGLGLGILGPVFLIIGSILAGIVLSTLGVPETAFIILGTSIGQILGFGGVALGYLRRRGYEWADIRAYLGVRVPSLRDLLVVVAGYVGIVVSLIVVSIVATLFLPEPAQNEGAQTAIENPEIIPAMIVMMLLVVGPFEELLFRGVVQNRLRENFDVFPAIAIASAIFAAVHVIALAGSLTGMLVTVTILFFPATIFGFVYEYTGNLVVPALLHGIHNSVLLSLILLGPELEAESAFVVRDGLLSIIEAVGTVAGTLPVAVGL